MKLPENYTGSANFVKCLLLLLKISRLPVEALQESVDNLEQIVDFYSDSSSENLSSTAEPEIVSGEIVETKTRPPLVLS
ncbi:MAG: hypothetical protein F6K47_15390 [Symploca sp. SIO2E6]|nr:hypothetical protein [Symploca sp. SIO2E6]